VWVCVVAQGGCTQQGEFSHCHHNHYHRQSALGTGQGLATAGCTHIPVDLVMVEQGAEVCQVAGVRGEIRCIGYKAEADRACTNHSHSQLSCS
jgi:hypothetical protein